MPEPTSPNHDVSFNPIWRDVFGQHADPSPARDAIDPGTADTIRQLHALGAAAPPVSSRERVRQSVRASIRTVNYAERTEPMNQALRLDAIPIGAERSRPSSSSYPAPWSRAPMKRNRRLWTALSVAAMIALVLGGIWHYSGSDNGGEGSRLPAVSGSPIPAPRTAGFVATPMVMGLLLSTMFPADAVANRPASAIFDRATIAPGGHATYDVPAAVIDHVVAGTYQIVAGCSVMLYRAGAPDQFTWTKPGVKYILQPGDSIVYPGGTSYCGKETVSNVGNTPLVFLGTSVIPDNFTPSSNPNATPDDIVGLTAETLDTIPSWQLFSIPAGPMAVTIERMTSAEVNASTPTAPQVKRLVAQEPSGAYLVITFKPASIPAATPSA